MRKFLITLLAVVTLGAGSAFAQSGMWAGVSTGYPFGVTVHFGMEDLLGPNLDLRASATGAFWGAFGASVVSVLVNGDVLYGLDLGGDVNLNTYVGGGVGIGFVSASGTGASASTMLWNVRGLFGAEYLLTPEWGIFGELHVGYQGASVNVPGIGAVNLGGFAPGLQVGGNYHF